ncbi:xanthine/CO dehydrogenase XdhC/CoxF family maturation factor [Dyadobacter jejuensis]|uniref:Xanthine/CO dehydrogenase XdhC/CoxF family maturation factor n=1 Tax=Dyadobacter jejuensis TaxID=1082580 RepID=A0A316AJH0_9BACT|nr:XdhC/CoxI family protein [Dyadobacter jejuensis]PWJ57124.1 xanthine/CO dehydrogenase XdhC/CoxF family maturation factor [Dyadobacter jejuensis]
MTEIQQILIAYHRAVVKGQAMALATVVLVEGSSYRRPGARMLVTDDGQLTGAISGGCLEGDALRKALLAISQGKNKLVTYDTTEGHDTTLGVQLGCNGIVHILFEPIHSDDPHNPIALLHAATKTRSPSVLITLFELKKPTAPQPGTCLLYANAHSWASENERAMELSMELHELAQRVFNHKASQFETFLLQRQRLTAFGEWIPLVPKLIIVGAGNDTIPLCTMAGLMGWHTVVVDGRATHATSKRFPLATEIYTLAAEEVLEDIKVDARTAVLLMTHNYHYDRSLLARLLPNDVCPYVGVLGPKSKLERMYDEIRSTGINITDQQKNKIYGPIGLEIGAETSEEIALSILAEIQAVFSGKQGGFLRNKTLPIHHRPSQKLQSHDPHQ